MKLSIGGHVLSALREKKPLVALETALVTHGLPRPLNLETAVQLEEIVTQSGAVPCTIGVLNGEIIMGLNKSQLDALAMEENPLKLGVRELPVAVAQKRSGGTTVAATAHLAHRYGIGVFATGGIGGVHRGGENTFDISGDLPVLARTPVTVVASGAKAILDLPLTLEYLETAGITVGGYQTNTLPAFYSAASPYPLNLSFDSVEQVAQTAMSRDELGLQAAILLCNPVPGDSEIPWDELMAMIVNVDREIREEGVVGQDVTPQMLRRLFTLSDGRTLQANLALLKENARLGAEIAQTLISIRGKEHG
ncbi:pseudouridine-5'-phosphate glycosidase [Dethiobacter alkaliphilus]|uniref:Pseudouridine-5'-phosphate glycosidase n=1 Tax=Dethiobacter alkaliphilus AHT 1 TaxID=555088 RepID=C0GKM7_DETAL|nr:pseudouridine-5'-phosphate glycosidase [Dethiobacter alkaliphilus]EEG76119.1 Indigoidine synthase A family protein [Dethiobacter alkaliphilus AHT 1]